MNIGFAFYLILSIRIERRKKRYFCVCRHSHGTSFVAGSAYDRRGTEKKNHNKEKGNELTHVAHLQIFTTFHLITRHFSSNIFFSSKLKNSKNTEMSRGLYCPQGMLGGDKQLHSVSEVFYEVSRRVFNSNFLLNSKIHELRELGAILPTEEKGRGQIAVSRFQIIILSTRNNFCLQNLSKTRGLTKYAKRGGPFSRTGKGESG